MYDNWFIDTIMNNLTIPAIVIVAGIFLKILQHYADKFVNLFSERQKVESVEKIASIRSNLIRDLDGFVKSAVASNMDMVDKMKAMGHKLTPEQIREVNESAKTIIYKSLPERISETMTPAEVLGGEHVMNALIESMMEKHVLEYKISRGIETSYVDDDTQSIVSVFGVDENDNSEIIVNPSEQDEIPPAENIDTEPEVETITEPEPEGIRVQIPRYNAFITTDDGRVG